MSIAYGSPLPVLLPTLRSANSFQIQCFEGLSKYRRQIDTLSDKKLQEVLEAYTTYHETHEINDDKLVFMSRTEIEKLNL